MPKFFYSVIFIVVLAWGLIALIVFRASPDTYSSIFLFIAALFITFGFTLSIPIYVVRRRKSPDLVNDNFVYRKSLKYGLFISFGVSGVAFLRAFRIMSLLNVGLFMLLYLGIFYQLKSKR